MKKIVGFGFCVLLLVVMNGCGGPDASFRRVSGIVTYDGVPVEGAFVAFIPQDSSGIAAQGTTDASGKYTLTSATAKRSDTGAKPGKYFVKISKTEVAVDPDQAAFDRGEISYDELQVRKASKGPYVGTFSRDLIPARYANHRTSGLEATVENKRDNECDFTLEK